MRIKTKRRFRNLKKNVKKYDTNYYCNYFNNRNSYDYVIYSFNSIKYFILRIIIITFYINSINIIICIYYYICWIRV